MFIHAQYVYCFLLCSFYFIAFIAFVLFLLLCLLLFDIVSIVFIVLLAFIVFTVFVVSCSFLHLLCCSLMDLLVHGA